MGIRPEDISGSGVAEQAYPNSTIKATVVVSELLGSESMLYSKTGETEFVCRVDARDFHNPGEEVNLTFNLNKAHFFEMDGNNARIHE